MSTLLERMSLDDYVAPILADAIGGPIPVFDGDDDENVSLVLGDLTAGLFKKKVNDHHSGFDPSEPRDSRGQWTRTGVNDITSKFNDALHDDEALDSSPIANDPSDQSGNDTKIGSHTLGQIREALKFYGSENYVYVNQEIRGAHGDVTDVDGAYLRQMIETLDDGMAHSRLSHDIVVYRGSTAPHIMFGSHWNETPGSMVGVEYHDYAFSSTSTDSDIGMAFAAIFKQNFKKNKKGDYILGNDGLISEGRTRTSGVQLRILVPKGTGAMAIRSKGSDEAEMLLERGLRFRIVADHVVDGDRLLDVEVINE